MLRVLLVDSLAAAAGGGSVSYNTHLRGVGGRGQRRRPAPAWPACTGLQLVAVLFLTLVLVPFTVSIAVGIGAGMVSYVVLRVVRGAAREIHPLLWVAAAAFLVYFAIDPVKALLGVS
jgi:hypothetical protein